MKKSQQQYQSVLQKLEGKLLALQSRRENLDTRAFVVVEEGETSVHRSCRSSTALDDQPELYHGEVRTVSNSLKLFQNYGTDTCKWVSCMGIMPFYHSE